MFSQKNRKPINLIILPIKGMCLFVVLYVVAALQYTNGLDAYANKVSFSFTENYLCDLLFVYTNQGYINPAHTTTQIALVIICSSLILFWYELPKLFPLKSSILTFMQICGILSMVILLFLNFDNHDIVIRISGIFGALAILLSLFELYKAGFYRLFILGFICFMMFLINYYIFESGILLELLPLIQKITFALCLSWLSYLNIMLYIHLKHIKND